MRAKGHEELEDDHDRQEERQQADDTRVPRVHTDGS